MNFEKQMRPVLARLSQAKRELDRTNAQPLPSAFCADHWENIILFGQCWKHNEDGSLKSMFAK